MSIFEKELKHIVDELKNLAEKEKNDILLKHRDEIFSEKFYSKLKEASPSEFIEFMLLLPPKIFTDFLDQYGDVIVEKIDKADIRTIAKIFDQLPKDLRKEFNSRFMKNLMNYARKLTISDIITMIHNVSAPSRPGLLSPMRSIMFSKDFEEKILGSTLYELEQFISVLPDDIRKQFFSRHRKVFLSDEFSEKIKQADKEEITNLVLRWFPQDLYREFVKKHEKVLSEKGLKLPI